MRRTCQVTVRGGTAHTIPMNHVEALQSIVTELGADAFPLFLRLGAVPISMQPVTARALLAEFEAFVPRLRSWVVPGLRFTGLNAEELGLIYARGQDDEVIRSAGATLGLSVEGIRLTVNQFPPPVGFRSNPHLPKGQYVCYFRQILLTRDGFVGLRTEAMGGSGAPVSLPDLAIPPVTKWDIARVAGKPAIASLDYVETPAPEVYKDLIHAFTAACDEALRLRVPLVVRP